MKNHTPALKDQSRHSCYMLKKTQDWEHFLRSVSWCRVHFSSLYFNKICLSWCNSKHEKEGGCVAYTSSQSACSSIRDKISASLYQYLTIWCVKLCGTLPQFPLSYYLLLNDSLCSLIFKAISLKLPWHDLVGGIWSLVKPQFSHLTSWSVSELSSVFFPLKWFIFKVSLRTSHQTFEGPRSSS